MNHLSRGNQRDYDGTCSSFILKSQKFIIVNNIYFEEVPKKVTPKSQNLIFTNPLQVE